MLIWVGHLRSGLTSSLIGNYGPLLRLFNQSSGPRVDCHQTVIYS